MRMLLAIWRAIQTFLETLWRVARQLFHEVAGAAFLLLSFSGAFSAWRYWKSRPPNAHGATGLWSIGVAVAFTLMMAAFSVASFRSARRVR
jgi:glycerol uptake facilitator-like aquaporin